MPKGQMPEGPLGNEEHRCLLHPKTLGNLQNTLRFTYQRQVSKATEKIAADT